MISADRSSTTQWPMLDTLLFDTMLACFGRQELEELLFYVLDVFGERSKVVTIIK